MDELDKGLDISVQGIVRDEALKRFGEQIQEWEISMPPVEPLVLDFGLGDFYTYGLIEFWIANEARAGYCGKYLFVFDGQTCPKHRHLTKHETFFLAKGNVVLNVSGSERTFTEGGVYPIAPRTFHSFTGDGPALLLELSTPCEISDNDFADSRIPIGRS